MSLLSLFSPIGIGIAAAQTQNPFGSNSSASQLGESTFKPWVDKKTLPGSSGLGTFNSTVTEKATGACLLTERQSGALQKLLQILKKDQQALEAALKAKSKVPDPRRIAAGDKPSEAPKVLITESNIASMFRASYKSRATTGKGLFDASAAGLSAKEVTLLQEIAASRLIPNPQRPSSFDNWSELYADVQSNPDIGGCDSQRDDLFDQLGSLAPKFSDIFNGNIGIFIVKLLVWPMLVFGGFLFSNLASTALGFSLTTPHSERGDTLNDAYGIYANNSKVKVERTTSCTPDRTVKDADGKVIPGQYKCRKIGSGNQVITCSSTKKDQNVNQLGFNCANALKKENKSSWLAVTNSLQITLSSVYGIMVVVSALAYLFKRNSDSAYNLKKVLPRIFGAVLIGISAPFFIGMLITLSNWIVQGLLVGNSASVPTLISQVLSGIAGGSGGLSDNAAGITGVLLMPVILIIISVLLVALLLLAIGKQLALILLLIITPLACVSLVVPSMRGLFSIWLKGLLVVCAISPVQAGILTFGLELSKAFQAAGGSVVGAVLGNLISAGILIMTFKLMVSAVRSLRAYATGNNSGMTSRFMAGAGNVAAVAFTAAGNPVAAAAAQKVALGASTALGGVGQRGGKWMPSNEGKILGRSEARVPQSAVAESMVGNLRQLKKDDYYNSMDRKRDRDNDGVDDDLQDGVVHATPRREGGGGLGGPGGGGGLPVGPAPVLVGPGAGPRSGSGPGGPSLGGGGPVVAAAAIDDSRWSSQKDGLILPAGLDDDRTLMADIASDAAAVGQQATGRYPKRNPGVAEVHTLDSQSLVGKMALRRQGKIIERTGDTKFREQRRMDLRGGTMGLMQELAWGVQDVARPVTGTIKKTVQVTAKVSTVGLVGTERGAAVRGRVSGAAPVQTVTNIVRVPTSRAAGGVKQVGHAFYHRVDPTTPNKPDMKPKPQRIER